MKREATFRTVERYYRQEHFDFFRPYQNPFYSVTFPLRLSALKRFAEEHEVSTYLSLCYFLTKAMQPLEDFRYRLREGRIVLYDQLDIGVTLPAPGGRFRFAYYAFEPDTEAFLGTAREKERSWEEAPQKDRLLEESERRNYVYFTALPKVPFTSFTHAVGSRDRAEPQVAFGKFYRNGGDLWVPVGLQVNHIFVDGAALGSLAEAAQQLYDQPI
ncbi:MAG: hypothetical protein KDD47_14340 [Acidobacteria bacterium]|nr:hypothetical protein [Acidobacteriota bacterium]